MFRQIKAQLSLMNNDISESEVKFAQEPETRVKKTIHRTFTHKFREVIRNSQTIQTEFKNAMQSRMRRQVKNAKPDVTEDELERLIKDPEAASKLVTEQVMGKAHSSIKNAVSDI